MNIDTDKIAGEIGRTWRSDPLIIGSQLLIIVLLGLTVYDRFETRRTVLEFVNHIMDKQDQKAEASSLREKEQMSEIIDRLNHLTTTNQEVTAEMTKAIVDCYEREHLPIPNMNRPRSSLIP